MKYFENTLLKKYKELFNYSHLINDLLKLKKKYYINNKGNKKSENNLIIYAKVFIKKYQIILWKKKLKRIFLGIL